MGLGEQTAQQLDFNSAHETCISFISITYCTRNSSIVYDFSNICVGYANKGRGKKKIIPRYQRKGEWNPTSF